MLEILGYAWALGTLYFSIGPMCFVSFFRVNELMVGGLPFFVVFVDDDVVVMSYRRCFRLL